LEHIIAVSPEVADRSVRDVVDGAVASVAARCSLQEAVQLSSASRQHFFLSVDGESVVGLVTDKDLLEGVQGRVSGLRNMAKRLKDEARHDGLTGLANRRYFDALLEREAGRHQRLGQCLGLIVLDIDHFKKINDRFGHSRGDYVLKELATRLRQSVRSTDLVARVGGEEFAILASVPSIHALLGLAEKVRRAVARELFSVPEVELASGSDWGPPVEDEDHCLESPRDLDVTVSLGAALLGGKIDSPRRLVRAADEALYTAKKNGRNRVARGNYQSSSADLPAVRPE
jgi:diguanylate cyclase (GGDEF)-like protein